MSANRRTIQIRLPAGDPRGIRIAEFSSDVAQLIDVPRSFLADFLKMPEAKKVALYFLFGDRDASERKVYIGQTGDVRGRFPAHDLKKTFWNRALVLVSKTDHLTLTHALFLESHCLRAALTAGRYAIENANSGSRPHTPETQEDECLAIFESASALLWTLGFPIFDAPDAASKAGVDQTLLFARRTGIDGRGRSTPQGFVVLKGSVGIKQNAPTFTDAQKRFRQGLIDAGVMREAGDTVVFEKDHVFGSPSAAALALLGKSANGLVEWKNAAGVTLADLEQQSTGKKSIREK